ncbi:MAG TPA: PP2C family protein-serine/threonine phosphatase [Micromonosporaceae bacterium]|nr:PP2C family protein-serine/threonine phosphatase [Micromonosporaceae bacterium]
MDDALHDWYGVLAKILNEAHLAAPDSLGQVISSGVRALGMEPTIYLVDVEQRSLGALPAGGPSSEVDPRSPGEHLRGWERLPVEGTMAGRAFMTLQTVAAGERRPRLWVPIVDGTERLGVLDVVLPEQTSPDDAAVREGCLLLAGLIGHLIMSKQAYGDTLHRVRRSRLMSTSAELLWQMLPPLTFATDRFVLTAMLEPCYEVGGDGFDYAVDNTAVHLSVLDAVGRGLSASMTCAVALSAMRAIRRAGGGLHAMAEAADQALTSQFTDHRFVTAILAELDESSGHLRYVNAGHPLPLVLRRGKAVLTLSGGRRLPLGLGNALAGAGRAARSDEAAGSDEAARSDETAGSDKAAGSDEAAGTGGPAGAGAVGEAMLEPGDRLLLHTDGVTDARRANGERSGLPRLVDLAERYSAAGLPIAETLRRLSHAILDQQGGRLRDDATLMLVEWSRLAAHRSVP